MEDRVVAAPDGVPLHVDVCGTGPDVLGHSWGSVPRDFWNTHPATWREVVTAAFSERL